MALDLLATDRSIDLVLLDVLMPVLDGYETLAAIKADDALRHIPVIVVSGARGARQRRPVHRARRDGLPDEADQPGDPRSADQGGRWPPSSCGTWSSNTSSARPRRTRSSRSSVAVGVRPRYDAADGRRDSGPARSLRPRSDLSAR